MGSVISKAKVMSKVFLRLSRSYDELNERLERSPGLPTLYPTIPYWAVPPNPDSCLRGENNTDWIEHADVVVIGSGITGTSIARRLLDDTEGNLIVVMLEARDTCSGATARNGGHITPPLHHGYEELVKLYGRETAIAIIRFRLAHLGELLAVAEAEGLVEESQCRTVATFDVYSNEDQFREMKRALSVYLDDLPDQKAKWAIYEAPKDIQALQLSPDTFGVIGTIAGAVHPYRFVTGILSRLLSAYPKSFHLFPHTPCTAVTSSSPSLGHGYVVETPKGTIIARHVVHATNGWTSHLLPGMRKKIIPIRGQMTAQRPGQGLGKGFIPRTSNKLFSSVESQWQDSLGGESWLGNRSFVFYGGKSAQSYDYLTGQPLHGHHTGLPSYPQAVSEVDDVDSSFQSSRGEGERISVPRRRSYPPPQGELMLGGGVSTTHSTLFEIPELGCSDDSEISPLVAAYLGGILPIYFGSRNWGREGDDDSADSTIVEFDDSAVKMDHKLSWSKGRVKHAWSGILGVSADRQPWVGRVPEKIARRQTVTFMTSTPVPTSEPGEWICAGYTGEGMVHAWKCGQALAGMILGEDSSDLPLPYLVDVERWKKAKVENLLNSGYA